MMNSIHYFLGIHLPQDISDRLKQQQTVLKQSLDYKLWTSLNDFHITLKFFGAIEEKQLSELIAFLEKVSVPEPFDCKLKGIGSFGKQDGPRVLMQSVEQTKPLLNTQKAFEKAAMCCGFPAENRQYTPHVTLAKKFISAAAPINEVIEKAEIERCHFTCDEVILFRIEPKSIPRYIPVARFVMKGGGADGTTY